MIHHNGAALDLDEIYPCKLIHALIINQISPHLTNATCVFTRTGKTMKYGRPRSVMCLEDVDSTMCPRFSLALHLFWRFDVGNEPIPNFADRSKWYLARIFTVGRDGGEYSAKVQYAAIKSMHKRHGVGGHVAHAARVSATQEDARNR